MTIALVQCAKQKMNYACPAQVMYSKSFWFRKAMQYAKELKPDQIYILSAKYHLIKPNQIIEPYDDTLKYVRNSVIKKWSYPVYFSLLEIKPTKIYFLAGVKYRKYLIPKLKKLGIECVIPMKDMKMGFQKSYLKEKTEHESIGDI